MNDLVGMPFSDPMKTQNMPEEWQKKTIDYGPSIKNADIVVTLNQNFSTALQPLIKKYAQETGLKIKTGNGTCGISAGKLSHKATDIGGYCCPPDTTDRLPGIRFHTLGIAAIAMIVHPDNPVQHVTLDQAQHIFSGEISRWSEIKPGLTLPIRTVARLHCKLRPGHWRMLLDNEDLFSPQLFEVGAIPDIITMISDNQGAIGYETLWMVHRYKDKGKVKIIKLDGQDPSDSSTLLSGKYPLYRVLNITTWEGAHVENKHAQKLVEYLLEEVEHLNPVYAIISPSRLRKAGWKFFGNELVGLP
ncbi:MAG: substrate-binding domain-containing protein [Nitrospiraceae bacterium]|nr:MAG: substrate-binding domain-containing protein [Nitrospiraceae bacterium]